MLEPKESLESETTAPAGAELRASEPLFSELIDRWLLEGDRLDEQARPAAGTAASPPDSWRKKALELGGRILEKHRLEVLVAIGLLPLMLFLITQGGGHHETTAASPPVRPARTVVATVLPERPSRVALVTTPESPHVRVVHKPATHHHRRIAHRVTHTPPPPRRPSAPAHPAAKPR